MTFDGNIIPKLGWEGGGGGDSVVIIATFYGIDSPGGEPDFLQPSIAVPGPT